MKLTPIEQLDQVLETIGKHRDADNQIMTDELQKHLKNKFNSEYNLADLKTILERIERDDYIRELPPNKKEFNLIQILFDGMLFIQNGMYREEKRIKDLNIKTLEADLRIKKRNEKLIAVGTIGGTLVIGLNLLWEMRHILLNLFKCH